MIPAVVYGHGETPVAVSISAREFELAMLQHKGGNAIVNLALNPGEYTALIRDVQYDPLSHDILHLDFQHISLTETVQVKVALHLTGLPTGVFKIANRVPNPTWYGPNHNIVPPGKGNPLGTRWMGLSRKGYGIHGTNNQRSIGHNASHGCIRMRKADVEELFAMVQVGDVVEMVAEPTEAMAWIFNPAEAADSAE